MATTHSAVEAQKQFPDKNVNKNVNKKARVVFQESVFKAEYVP